MVTNRLIDHQYTFMPWPVLCFDVLLMKYKCVEYNHTFSCNSLD
jgi:hypothetical protein